MKELSKWPILALAAAIISCTGSHPSTMDPTYAYEANGYYYQLRIENGRISDTCSILNQSGELIEKAFWSHTDTAGQVVFHQKTLFRKSESIDSKPDSINRSSKSELATIKKNAPKLRRIYKDYLGSDWGLKGVVRFKFWVKPTGKIAKILILENSSRNKEFAIALLREISTWVFEPIESYNETVMVVPFTFSE